MVPLAKLGSWYLLMIISVVLVSLVQKPEEIGKTTGEPADTAIA
jgi:uncharacterized membrane protein YoaT (DUF817 family)